MAIPRAKYPRHTDDLRQIVKALGFKQSGTNVSGTIIYYRNIERNEYKKINLPKSNHISKMLAVEVLSSIKTDFGYSDNDILGELQKIQGS